jgi:hypothetical protein
MLGTDHREGLDGRPVTTELFDGRLAGPLLLLELDQQLLEEGAVIRKLQPADGRGARSSSDASRIRSDSTQGLPARLAHQARSDHPLSRYMWWFREEAASG